MSNEKITNASLPATVEEFLLVAKAITPNYKVSTLKEPGLYVEIAYLDGRCVWIVERDLHDRLVAVRPCRKVLGKDWVI